MYINLTHSKWIKTEFTKKELFSKQFRNAIMHASIIEGILRNISNTESFSQAILTLLIRGQIPMQEAQSFDKVRELRNRLLHNITDEHKLPDMKSIGMLRDNLMENIREVYKKSVFLDEHLFKKYGIKIRSYIPFESPTN